MLTKGPYFPNISISSCSVSWGLRLPRYTFVVVGSPVSWEPAKLSLSLRKALVESSLIGKMLLVAPLPLAVALLLELLPDWDWADELPCDLTCDLYLCLSSRSSWIAFSSSLNASKLLFFFSFSFFLDPGFSGRLILIYNEKTYEYHDLFKISPYYGSLQE